MVHGPDVPERAADVIVRPFRCWSASCRRCGPIVGAQDLARLEPAITGRRWLYVVVTLDPRRLWLLQRAAAARGMRALERWSLEVEELIGPPPTIRDECDLDPWDPFGVERPGPRSLDLAAQRREWAAWWERATAALPLPRGRSLSGDAYHVASTAWSNHLRRSLRRRFGPVETIVTWERHRSGLPHANILLELEPFEGALVKLKRKKLESGRWGTYPPALRSWMAKKAIEAGFGKIFHLEIAEPRSAALGAYMVKLSRELMSSRTKGPEGQTPLNRPRGFRRFSATQRTLPVRIWPKGRLVPCTVEGCATEPPPGGWCSRSLPLHLERVHGWDRDEAREHVRDLVRELAPAHVAIVEGERPRRDVIAYEARHLGTDEVSTRAWLAVADEITTGAGSPLYIAENGETAPLLV
jgi:hypothetical protein